MKPKSLQTSVSKRGARAESFFGQPSGPLVFPSVLAKASQDSIFHTVQYWDGFGASLRRQYRERETVGPGALRGIGGGGGRGGEGKGRRGWPSIAPE